MKFSEINVGDVLWSSVNKHSAFVVLEKKRGGWLLVRPQCGAFADLRFNVRAAVFVAREE